MSPSTPKSNSDRPSGRGSEAAEQGLSNSDPILLADLQDAIDQIKAACPASYVYAVWNVDRHAVKIGFSASPVRRFKQLKTACCDPLVLWVHFSGNRLVEQVLHEMFSPWRMEGEWFDASDGYVLKTLVEQALTMGGRV